MEKRIDTLYYHCLIVLMDNPRYINGMKIDQQSCENLIAVIRDPLHLKNIERIDIRLMSRDAWTHIMALIAKRWSGDNTCERVLPEPSEVPFKPSDTKVSGVKYIPGSDTMFKVELNGSHQVIEVKRRKFDFAGRYKMVATYNMISKYSRCDLSPFGITNNKSMNYVDIYDERAFAESGLGEIFDDAVELGLISPRINIPKQCTMKY